ncbi:Nucleolar GTP-binding protein 1 [Cardamine amara subsp. amara]|uniref:Nucleolar GTP-binding protein 1 n=1 Tax=Cardamine amara subsp. amara TaxID=228776 RepID=A0ABD0YZL1_CARAN
MEEKNNFKKISEVPSESYFADVIVANMAVRPKRGSHMAVRRKNPNYATECLNHLRHSHLRSISSVKKSFANKFYNVYQEFRASVQIDRSYFGHFSMRYMDADYMLALEQVFQATTCVAQIACWFKELLRNTDDCDSLEKCNRLKVSALGCMYTVAVKCLPSLAYLEHVRQYMASLTESDLEDKIAISSSTVIKYDKYLDKKDCTVPFCLDVQNLAGFAPHNVLSWISRLELDNALRLVEAEKLAFAQMEAHNLAYAQQLEFAKHSHNPKEHLLPAHDRDRARHLVTSQLHRM